MSALFVYPIFAWGLALASLPLLIHMINRFRQRKIEWAAIDFLLKSNKQYQTRVRLRELLLLLIRTAIICLIVLIAAGPTLRERIGSFFGGVRIDHIILLDDSFSMAQRNETGTAFDQAKKVIRQIARRSATGVRPQTFTLIKFSACPNDALPKSDIDHLTVDSQFDKRIADALEQLNVGQTATGPLVSLDAINRLPEKAADSNRIVYMLSDFRKKDYAEIDRVGGALKKLSDQSDRLYLIDCSKPGTANLSVSKFESKPRLSAAGIPIEFEIGLTNHGPTEVKQVPVQLVYEGRSGKSSQTLMIESVSPGKTSLAQTSIRFPRPGPYRLQTIIADDPVITDNRRNLAIDIPTDLPVLIVEPRDGTESSQTLSKAFAPGGPVQTGIQPRIVTPRFLSLNKLTPFRAIVLTDISSLDKTGVRAVREYLTAGGQLLFFLGPNTDPTFFNQKFRKGDQPLLGFELNRPSSLRVDPLEQLPDIKPTDHRLFKIFTGKSNPFLDMVKVDRFWSVKDTDQLSSGTTVLARTRTGQPLIVENRTGDGRLISILTTAAPTWNNWAKANPSFVVFLQETIAYLSEKNETDKTHTVGDPLKFNLKRPEYHPWLDLVVPSEEGPMTRRLDPVGSNDLSFTFKQTDFSGFYTARLARLDGRGETQTIALNVNEAEGDLKRIDPKEFQNQLTAAAISYQFDKATDFQAGPVELENKSIAPELFFVLLGLMILEPWMAKVCSYLPRKVEKPGPSVATRQGGRR
jgi:aerotolerance regulator-like protein